MKFRINVVCLIEREGKILLGKKATGVGPYIGCWLIPGGGVDLAEESLDEAMKREVLEETSLEVKEYQRMFFDEDITERKGEIVRLVYHYYRITGVKTWEALKPGSDLVELRWFAFSELQSLNVPPVSLKTYKKLGYI